MISFFKKRKSFKQPLIACAKQEKMPDVILRSPLSCFRSGLECSDQVMQVDIFFFFDKIQNYQRYREFLYATCTFQGLTSYQSSPQPKTFIWGTSTLEATFSAGVWRILCKILQSSHFLALFLHFSPRSKHSKRTTQSFKQNHHMKKPGSNIQNYIIYGKIF